MKNNFPCPSAPLRIGTRGSPLSLAQGHETRKCLAEALNASKDSFEIVVISTSGDRILDRPLKEVGGKGLFTKEIEQESSKPIFIDFLLMCLEFNKILIAFVNIY